jgi:hypothetical protein
MARKTINGVIDNRLSEMSIRLDVRKEIFGNYLLNN